jgi:hypothetical protein
VRPIASWLTARPVNTILGLSLSLLLPFAQIVSGAALVAVVLKQGAQQAMLKAGAALLLLVVLSMVVGNSVPHLMVNALVAWLPVGLLALLLRSTGSLTLTLQVSVIVAVAVTIGFHVVLGDPTEFWTGQLAELVRLFSEMGRDDQATLLSEYAAVLAPQMTMVFVLVSWSVFGLVLALGYALFQTLPDNKARYGRFCDLNLGRVLAVAMAITSLLALVSDAAWVQNLAFVMFAVFWVQGLAILHWLQTDGPLPMLVLVVAYAMLPFLNALLVTALAVLGYTDAWFGYRARIAARRRGT